jgi:hypothetical protein
MYNIKKKDWARKNTNLTGDGVETAARERNAADADHTTYIYYTSRVSDIKLLLKYI